MQSPEVSTEPADGVVGNFPDVFIGGTARSGTTLVQRLVCELDGVAVPPESHFLNGFLSIMLRRWGRCLSSESDVASAAAAYFDFAGLQPDVGSIIERLDLP